MMPIGIVNLGRHWLGKWLVPWWHQTISWTMMLNHQWGLVAFTWGQFNKKCLRYLSLIWFWKLYEWTARQQLKSPQSLPGRSIHHTPKGLIMVMNDLLPLPLCNVNQPSHSETQLFQNFTMKIHGQGHLCGQRSRSHLTLKIQSQGHGQSQTRWSHSSPSAQSICLLFVSWQSDHFWLRYSKFYIWPWKFKVMVMAKVKLDGHIWALEFNRYVCFSFCGNWTIFCWDIANSVFDLEKSRSRSRRKSTKI